MRRLWLASALLALMGRDARADPPAEEIASRHQLGVQLGGSSPAELFYQFHAVGPLQLRAGVGGLPALGMWGSAGVRGLLRAGRAALFLEAGMGGGAYDLTFLVGCINSNCDSEVLYYAYGRGGYALFGPYRQGLSFDIGVWIGRRDREIGKDASFVAPMVGFSYFFGL